MRSGQFASHGCVAPIPKDAHADSRRRGECLAHPTWHCEMSGSRPEAVVSDTDPNQFRPRGGLRQAEPAGPPSAKTEHSRLLVRDLRRARTIPKPTAREMPSPSGQTPSKVPQMNTPYGLEIVESCLTCKLRKDYWFCGLSPEVLKLLSAASHLSTYPGNAVLFVEGQLPRGVCAVLREGETLDHFA